MIRSTVERPTPVAFKFICPVEFAGILRRVFGIFHVEAHAVVAYEHHLLSINWPPSDFDYGLTASAGVLQGVGDQVHEDLFRQSRVTGDATQFPNFHSTVRPEHSPREFLDRAL